MYICITLPILKTEQIENGNYFNKNYKLFLSVKTWQQFVTASDVFTVNQKTYGFMLFSIYISESGL